MSAATNRTAMVGVISISTSRVVAAGYGNTAVAVPANGNYAIFVTSPVAGTLDIYVPAQ